MLLGHVVLDKEEHLGAIVVSAFVKNDVGLGQGDAAGAMFLWGVDQGEDIGLIG